jgi:hypothetical protein
MTKPGETFVYEFDADPEICGQILGRSGHEAEFIP